MKKIDYIGKKFGQLTVKNHVIKRKYECLCDCGNSEIKLLDSLIYDGTTCCRSCTNKILSENNREKLEGLKFNMLEVISYSGSGKYKCVCDCGKEIITDSYRFKSGSTKSCGCFRAGVGAASLKVLSANKPAQSAVYATAKKVYSFYKKDGLSFDKFYELSQQNCHYCKYPPSRRVNAALYKSNDSRFKRFDKDDYQYVYNGLDRIDSSLGHEENNVVPCCSICNWAKSNYSVDEFLAHIRLLVCANLRGKQIPKYDIRLNDYLRSFLVAHKRIKGRYLTDYSDGLSFEEFLGLSQYECFYCGGVGGNKIKYGTLEFVYNGLDRVDNMRDHIIDNVVPCCKKCNTAKSDMGLLEFYDWIDRFKYL